MTDTTNPRAFPSAAIDPRYGGMQLRDWFAGQIVCGILANPRLQHKINNLGIAEYAYGLADIMVCVREEDLNNGTRRGDEAGPPAEQEPDDDGVSGTRQDWTGDRQH